MTENTEALLRRQAAVLEQAIEAALQTGCSGVRVWRWSDEFDFYIKATVDPTVPYGMIYEHSFGENPRAMTENTEAPRPPLRCDVCGHLSDDWTAFDGGVLIVCAPCLIGRKGTRAR